MKKLDQLQVKSLLKDQKWEAVIRYMAEVIDKWQSVSVKAPDQFNTTWNQATKEGKIEGLKEFFNGLEHEALND